jgi:hypothetical protein
LSCSSCAGCPAMVFCSDCSVLAVLSLSCSSHLCPLRSVKADLSDLTGQLSRRICPGCTLLSMLSCSYRPVLSSLSRLSCLDYFLRPAFPGSPVLAVLSQHPCPQLSCLHYFFVPDALSGCPLLAVLLLPSRPGGSGPSAHGCPECELCNSLINQQLSDRLLMFSRF